MTLALLPFAAVGAYYLARDAWLWWDDRGRRGLARRVGGTVLRTPNPIRTNSLVQVSPRHRGAQLFDQESEAI